MCKLSILKYGAFSLSCVCNNNNLKKINLRRNISSVTSLYYISLSFTSIILVHISSYQKMFNHLITWCYTLIRLLYLFTFMVATFLETNFHWQYTKALSLATITNKRTMQFQYCPSFHHLSYFEPDWIKSRPSSDQDWPSGRQHTGSYRDISRWQQFRNELWIIT